MENHQKSYQNRIIGKQKCLFPSEKNYKDMVKCFISYQSNKNIISTTVTLSEIYIYFSTLWDWQLDPHPYEDLFLHQIADGLPQLGHDVGVHAVKQPLPQGPKVSGQVLEQLVNGLQQEGHRCTCILLKVPPYTQTYTF